MLCPGFQLNIWWISCSLTFSRPINFFLYISTFPAGIFPVHSKACYLRPCFCSSGMSLLCFDRLFHFEPVFCQEGLLFSSAVQVGLWSLLLWSLVHAACGFLAWPSNTGQMDGCNTTRRYRWKLSAESFGNSSLHGMGTLIFPELRRTSIAHTFQARANLFNPCQVVFESGVHV